jgi:hypothetical protein
LQELIATDCQSAADAVNPIDALTEKGVQKVRHRSNTYIIAAEIVDDLQAALIQFAEIASTGIVSPLTNFVAEPCRVLLILVSPVNGQHRTENTQLMKLRHYLTLYTAVCLIGCSTSSRSARMVSTTATTSRIALVSFSKAS